MQIRWYNKRGIKGCYRKILYQGLVETANTTLFLNIYFFLLKLVSVCACVWCKSTAWFSVSSLLTLFYFLFFWMWPQLVVHFVPHHWSCLPKREISKWSFVLFSVFNPAVCTVHGEEDPLVCLLGRLGDFVISRPWHRPSHFPSLPGKKSRRRKNKTHKWND